MIEREGMISKREAEAIAVSASEKALKDFWRTLDVDLSNFNELRDLREDLGFLRDQRRGSEEVKAVLKKGGWGVVFSVVIPGALYGFWVIFKAGLPTLFPGGS